MAKNEPVTGLLLCDCASPEHCIHFMYWEDDDDDKEVYVTIHLKKRKLWGRIKYGLKYIFGYKCKYGAFDEIILRPEDCWKIENILYKLEKCKKDD